MFSGVFWMWTEVSRRLGVGCAVGAIWWRKRVDAGPDDKITEYSGWKDRDVIADGCARGISRVLWISRTSGRSFARFPGTDCVRVRKPASCSSRASGRVERLDSSISISLDDTEESDPAEDLRRRLVGLVCAHSGAGCSISNCLRNRLV